jgi:hypothetical protein
MYQGCGSALFNADPDPVDQKLEKITAGFFVVKNCNLLIPRPPLRTLQEKPSALKREHPAL